VVGFTTVTVPSKPPEREECVPEYPVLVLACPRTLEMRTATRMIEDKEGIFKQQWKGHTNKQKLSSWNVKGKKSGGVGGLRNIK
jgi:hypothetical protein